MFDPAVVFATLFLYIGLLFLVGFHVERQARRGRNLANNPYVYSLAIAVYCTSWTYYGSVGLAANSGLLYLATYLGPTLVMILGWKLLGKMVALKESAHITSIADFISARYDRSLGVAALATVLVLVGNIPYIALQIKAVIATLELMVGAPGGADGASGKQWLDEVAVAAVIVLTISFGLRRLDTTERHPGVMAVLAAESLVKLVAILAVGVFVTFVANDGFGALFAAPAVRAWTAQLAGPAGPAGGEWYLTWMTHLVLAMAAILFLPRQFHVMVVENSNPRHIRTAIWLFPLYLLLINLFVLPIAAAGLAAGFPVDGADTFVLRLPLAHHNLPLTLLVFLGGFSAAVGMVMVSSMATAIMFTNHMLLPALHWLPRLRFLRGYLLQCRWAAVSATVVLGYWFAKAVGDSYLLVRMGHISFAAFLQFAPIMLGALFWRRGNKVGAQLGLSGGIVVWAYTLFLPALIKSGWLPLDILADGPWGLGFLHPERLFGLVGLSPLSHAVFWSLLINSALYVLGSLWFQSDADEQAIAERFVGAGREAAAAPAHDGGEAYVDLEDKTRALEQVFSQYVPREAAARLVADCVAARELPAGRPITVNQLMTLLADAETRLAGSIGTASAHQAMREGAFLTPRESTDLAHAYGDILAGLKVSPADLKRRVDYYQELNAQLEASRDELEQRVVERTADIEKLRRSNQLILDSLGEGVYGVDMEGRFTFANPALERMMGWRAAELIGRPSHATLHHSHPDGKPYPEVECPLYRSFETGEVRSADDETFWRKDGSSLPVEYTTNPIREDGRLVGAVVVFKDITQRRQAEQELRHNYDELKRMNREIEEAQSQLLQSEKMASIGQLAAGIAHEINNPIGFVNSNLGSLQRYVSNLLELVAAYERAEALLPADAAATREVTAAKARADLDYLREDVASLLRESVDGVGRVKRIVQDLKDFSHVDNLDWQEADLHHGLDSTLNVVWNELKYKADVVKEYGSLPAVECMASQINQVFMNLLVNAAQAIERHGTITIRTGTDGYWVWIEIADTGRGIAPEHLGRIFDPFFTTKPVGKGTGLGLSISYGIVKKHGGTIEVSSTEGKGTTFRIVLPRRRAPATGA